MKVPYLHRTSAQNGSAIHIDGLIAGLRSQGVEVVLVAPAVANRSDGRSGGPSSRLRRMLPRAAHELLELVYNVPEAIRLVRALRKHRPDAIYERANLFMVSGALIAPRFGVPRIAEVNAPYFLERCHHGGIAFKRLARWTERFSWQQAAAVVPVTEVLAEIVENSGVPRDRIHVMGNGIDAALLQSAAIRNGARERLGWDNRLILGFTGFVREWNGLEAVIDLLGAPGNEALSLLLVGDGPARPALEARAKGAGVSGRVHITGKVSRSEVAGWVSEFDVALQPAANPYASPLKLFEYMALSRAIVAPDQANIREVLHHGRDALLFDPKDPSALARAIGMLAADPSLRERLAMGANKTLLEREMTWTNNARRVINLANRMAIRRPQVAS